MKKIICIIPARKGSKRIKKKNIKIFNKKPIIFWSIKAAIKSNIFDEIMVSTDSNEIASYSKNLGVKVPFLRSKFNSDDLATTNDVVLEVLSKYKEIGMDFDLACCLYPTAAFVTPKYLIKGKNKLIKSNLDAILPITEINAPIWRSFKRDTKGLISHNFPKNVNSRSQDLPKAYADAGQWYWFNVKSFFKTKKILSKNTGSMVLPSEIVQDIDNDKDWKIAELKHKRLIKSIS